MNSQQELNDCPECWDETCSPSWNAIGNMLLDNLVILAIIVTLIIVPSLL